MAATGSNFVFSPLSIRAGLSLTAVGSKGETLEQMLSFLGSPTLADLNSAAAQLLGSVSGENGATAGPRLSFVNGVWVEQSLELKTAFQEVAASVYGAIAKSVDLENRAEEVSIEVNDWLKKKTDGLIKNLIPETAVDDATRLLIANALCFKGFWSYPFESSQTRYEEFHLLNGSTIQVPFMRSREDQFISSYDGFKVLKLPYEGSYKDWRRFSMLIFLPHKKDGLNELTTKFVSDTNFINRHIPTRPVEVGKFGIPKFKISFGFEASAALKGLGLESPFTTKADFHEMFSNGHPDQQLFVSSMLHEAAIEVDEEGTLAAAATDPIMDFQADHPFVFVIREEVTGSSLFFGHVVHPSLADHQV
ncbi:Serpin-Z1B [Cocos nucifera]|uniref:Serpin-Z1B n=1 Tax=Cocos nucifera TaxID=13894 RepID=A0A8K0IFZ0_COCNU|nr:Serpin-Z1B [Cocos nucifera]